MAQSSTGTENFKRELVATEQISHPLKANFKLWPVWVADDKQQMYQRTDSLPRQLTRFQIFEQRPFT